MNKIILTAFISFILGTTAIAQYKQNAIGLRLGGGNGFGGEVSYQRALGENNRLEIDLGLRGDRNVNAFRVVGIYQWVWNFEGNFNWYAGFGAGLGAVDYNDGFRDNSDDYVLLSVDGQIGIEYLFQEVPIQIALDTRPAFFVISDDFFYSDLDLVDIALSVRYQFN